MQAPLEGIQSYRYTKFIITLLDKDHKNLITMQERPRAAEKVCHP